LEVLDRRRLIVASLTPLLALITLYTQLTALNHYVSTLTEVVYVGPGYVVAYRSPLLPFLAGNDTRLTVEVLDEEGKPARGLIVTLVAPKAEGGFLEDVAASRGAKVSKGVGHIVSEARRLVASSGGRVDSDGPAIMLLISAIVEEGGELYAAPDIATVPIIPGKAVGKEIIATIKVKPPVKYRIEKAGNNSKDKASIEPAQQPPSKIQDYCEYLLSTYVCYYWKYNATIATFYDRPVSLMLTYLDSYDGDYIRHVTHTAALVIERTTNSYIGFSIGLAQEFKVDGTSVAEIVAPGVSFTLTLRSGESQRYLLDVGCKHYNSKLVNDKQSSCIWREGGTYYSRSVSSFYDEAIVALQLIASRLDFLHYLYVRAYYEWISEGVIWWVGEVVGHAVASYMVPRQRPFDGSLDFTTYVDNDPYDGSGDVEEDMWTILRHFYITSWIKRISYRLQNQQWVRLFYADVSVYVDETAYFAVSIALASAIKWVLDRLPSSVRALPKLPRLLQLVDISIDLGTSTYSASTFVARFEAEAVQVGNWDNFVYYYDKYIPVRVKLEGEKYKDVPVLLWRPYYSRSS